MNTHTRSSVGFVVGALALFTLTLPASASAGGWKETLLGSTVAVTREFDVDASACQWKLVSDAAAPILSAECSITYLARDPLDQFLGTNENLGIRSYKDRAGNKVTAILSPMMNGFLFTLTSYRAASTSNPAPVPIGSFSESPSAALELMKMYLVDELPSAKIHVQVQTVKR